MYFDSFADAVAMAGHGPYVWAAYGLTLLVVVALVTAPLRRSRELQRQIRADIARQSAADHEACHAPQA